MEPNFFSDAITTPSDAAQDRKEMNEGRGQGSGKSQSVECGAKTHTHTTLWAASKQFQHLLLMPMEVVPDPTA